MIDDDIFRRPAEMWGWFGNGSVVAVFSSDKQLGIDIKNRGDRFRRPAEMRDWFGNGSVVAVFSGDKQLGVDIEKCSDRFRRPLPKWRV